MISNDEQLVHTAVHRNNILLQVNTPYDVMLDLDLMLRLCMERYADDHLVFAKHMTHHFKSCR